MEKHPVTVNRISWRDVCPPVTIFRALPVALNLAVLVLATLGTVLTPLGWNISDRIFLSETVLSEAGELAAIAERNRSPYKAVFPATQENYSNGGITANPVQGVGLVFTSIGDSVGQLFSLRPGLSRFFYFLVGSLWTILVWSFFGCAICRVALMQLARDEPIGITDACKFAFDKALSCFAGVLVPLLVVFGLAIPLAIIGLIMTSNPGATIGGFLWFIVLAISFLIAIILLGLMFAWPLIVAAVACEGQDSFDGMSRAFAYVYQRPIHFFVYALIALIFSGICWIVVAGVVEGSIKTAWWATSWGSNLTHDRAGELRQVTQAVPGSANDLSGSAALQTNSGESSTDETSTPESTEAVSLRLGRTMIRFWEGFLKTIGAAFLHGLFWSLASAIYLLLRKDLDNTEMDEIFLVEQRRTYELPPLKATPSGVPAIDDDKDRSRGDDSESNSGEQ